MSDSTPDDGKTATTANFCDNEKCYYGGVAMPRNAGDTLRHDDGSYVRRYLFTGGGVERFFCEVCTNAIRLSRGGDVSAAPKLAEKQSVREPGAA